MGIFEIVTYLGLTLLIVGFLFILFIYESELIAIIGAGLCGVGVLILIYQINVDINYDLVLTDSFDMKMIDSFHKDDIEHGVNKPYIVNSHGEKEYLDNPVYVKVGKFNNIEEKVIEINFNNRFYSEQKYKFLGKVSNIQTPLSNKIDVITLDQDNYSELLKTQGKPQLYSELEDDIRIQNQNNE